MMHDITGVIGSTGPEMRRFFFTVDHAVRLVKDAIDNIEDIHGQILSREMKSAQMSDILDVWVEMYGGKWEKIEGRPGERNDEYLVGDIELEYTSRVAINGVNHFLISPNTKVTHHQESVVHSGNCPRLTKEEIKELILAKPDIL
jgi:FlaA1/EpsC-like NDP-sugar epimerase